MRLGRGMGRGRGCEGGFKVGRGNGREGEGREGRCM
jgi:hypothetical protein